MKATIVKTRCKRKHYGKVKSWLQYEIPEIGKDFQSGYWDVKKLKKMLKSKGYTEIEVVTNEYISWQN